MKTKLIFLTTAFWTTLFSYGQYEIDSTLLNLIAGVDSTYLYDKDGNKEWYYIQKDVYCFQIMGDAEYTPPLGAVIDEKIYWNTATSRFNEVHFNPSATWLQKAEFVEYITGLPNYKRSSFALTKNSSSDYSNGEFYRSDDQLLITFNDPLLSAAAIDSFANEYGLYVVYAPSPLLPNSVSWTYTFRIATPQGQAQDMVSIILAQIINENEPELVKLAEPNLYATYSLGCSPTTEVGGIVGGINGTWHIRNDGGEIWSGYSGTADADADICECWGEGYTGANIKVGIIDFGGIEFGHDDFEGTNLVEVYRASTGTYSTSDVYVDPFDGHGMKVTGIIGATPNNNGLGYRYAVGAAYGAEVRPYLVTGFVLGSPAVGNAQISQCIMRNVVDGVDVVNMSFRTDAAVGSIDIQINNATLVGRPHDGDAYYGIVFVAGVGNDDLSGSNFPANMPNVIGVGWTNPEDYRSNYFAPGTGGGWTVGTAGIGSTYGDPENNYDVVAPGELLWTTDIETTPGAYTAVLGSSFSSPLVASIAAILLDKNPALNYTEVRDLIRMGAEKVHPETYNYGLYGDAPGYNEEMFYGRVSCINSLNSVLSVPEESEAISLSVFRQDVNNYLVFIPSSQMDQTYELIDMSGRVLFSSAIAAGQTEILVNLSSYSGGLYILRLNNGEKSIATTKLLK